MSRFLRASTWPLLSLLLAHRVDACCPSCHDYVAIRTGTTDSYCHDQCAHYPPDCKPITAIVCRIAFRVGNRPTRRLWDGRARQGIAWAFNLGFWACSCWVIVAYGRCLEREQTDEILLSSLLGFSVSWFVMEPLWVLLITVALCLFNTNWANDRANDVGLDLSMLMG